MSLAESVAPSGNNLKNISDHIWCLRQFPPVHEMIRYREGNKVNRDTNSTYQIWVERMQILFASMIGIKPYYMQLRYRNEKGNEGVRLDYDGTHIKIIPNSQVQNQDRRG